MTPDEREAWRLLHEGTEDGAQRQLRLSGVAPTAGALPPLSAPHPPRRPMVGHLRIDTNGCETELCRIAAKHGCDRSPVNRYRPGGLHFRHAYTPIYHFLFGAVRNDPLAIAEIGILQGAGLTTLREYFPRAELFGFDFDEGRIRQCEGLGLAQTHLGRIDVRDAGSIAEAFRTTGCRFDLILDDSSHAVGDQVRVIGACRPFLAPGGLLIIEDVFQDERAPEERFTAAIDASFRAATFVLPQDERIHVGRWNNEKLLVLVAA